VRPALRQRIYFCRQVSGLAAALIIWCPNEKPDENPDENRGFFVRALFLRNRGKMGLYRVLAAVLAFICITGGIQATALAYVLDGRHVIERMLEEMDLPARMQVEQTLTLFDDRFEGGRIAVKQTLSYHLPGRFRSEIRVERLHRIYVAADDASITIVDGQIVSRQSDAAHRYKDLFCYSDRQALVNHLAYLGLNPRLSSYGRADDEVVYVIGARYPAPSPPQLWVSKDRFLPLRWVLPAPGPNKPGANEPGAKAPRNNETDKQRLAAQASAKNRLAFQYEDWRVAGGSRYPGVIKVYQGERLTRKIEVNQIHINPALPENLFDIDYLRAAYAKAAAEPARTEEQAGKNSGDKPADVKEEGAEDEIDQQIEEFRSIFESE